MRKEEEIKALGEDSEIYKAFENFNNTPQAKEE